MRKAQNGSLRSRPGGSPSSRTRLAQCARSRQNSSERKFLLKAMACPVEKPAMFSEFRRSVASRANERLKASVRRAEGRTLAVSFARSAGRWDPCTGSTWSARLGSPGARLLPPLQSLDADEISPSSARREPAQLYPWQGDVRAVGEATQQGERERRDNCKLYVWDDIPTRSLLAVPLQRIRQGRSVSDTFVN